MSGWLKNVGSIGKNVGTFLEKLDDQAEQVIEERRTSQLSGTGSEDDSDPLFSEEGEKSLSNILAARGLQLKDDGDDDDDVEEGLNPNNNGWSEHDNDEVLLETITATNTATDTLETTDDAQHKVMNDDAALSPIPPQSNTIENEVCVDLDLSSTTANSAVAVQDAADDRTNDDKDNLGVVESSEGPSEVSAKEGGLDDENNYSDNINVIEASDDLSNSSQKEIEVGDVATAIDAETAATQKNDVTKSLQPPVEKSEPEKEARTTDAAAGNLVDEGAGTNSNAAAAAEAPPQKEGKPLVENIISMSAISQAAAAVKKQAAVVAAASSRRAPATVKTSSNAPANQQQLQWIAKAKEAQKEARTLRRHVVSLNTHLEKAEAEMDAQRKELDRAAERLEKDRIRHKEEREKEKARHAEEIKAAKLQANEILQQTKQNAEEQLENQRKELRIAEERRMQEGGDWNKEMATAVQREKEMSVQLAAMEDEKSVLLAQVATLQAQQEALGNRLESLTQTADSAMERERDAEDRLDEALSLHAHQLGQRQAREAELEKTMAELGAALVAAQGKEQQTFRQSTPGGPGSNNKSHDDGVDANDNDNSPQIRLQAVENEIENVRAELAHEKQRCRTLQNELRDVSNERREDTSGAHTQQLKHDREIAELSQTVARLKLELRECKEGGSDGALLSKDGPDDFDDERTRIKDLSEELIRRRESVTNSNIEISALKSRLRGALDRASKAETALEEYRNIDIESGAPSSTNGGVRRRNIAGGSSRVDSSRPSIRAALHLDTVRGKNVERIGEGLDGLDTFVVKSGKFLRYNPLARLLFIVYLLMLHLWCFFVLFLHTHSYETVHGDFGAGGMPLGPGALMSQQQQKNIMAQIVSHQNQTLK